MSNKYVYFFGGGQTEGSVSLKNLLGGKGANLADMAELGLPVPPGFTVTTEACSEFYNLGKDKLLDLIKPEINKSLSKLEITTHKTFGKGPQPLLLSVRSGAAVSMPGMMDTVLNLGLNDETVEAMIALTKNERFVMDSYRRFIQMFGNVVMGVPHHEFETQLDKVKSATGKLLDTDLDVSDLKELIKLYKDVVQEISGEEFPEDPMEQLWRGITAVFGSWNNPRAIKYRQLNDIRSLWGTAVNVQAMVFGNSGDNSATGVAFTRDPSTGANEYFYGEYLINAQGEDVVAGIRTPQQITIAGSRAWATSQGISEGVRVAKFPSLEEIMPHSFAELDAISEKLEKHYKDMQDLEFTIENGTLYMLQTRSGKRTAQAAVKIAYDLKREGLISEKEAVLRIDPRQLDQLLHPVFVKESEVEAKTLTIGLPASPGAATGQVVFSAKAAEDAKADGRRVILCRFETSPEDIGGMDACSGILTARGGMTSHAAVVARGMGKCCVSGAGDLKIDYKASQFAVNGTVVKEGDWISLNGSTGALYLGKVDTVDPTLEGAFGSIMELANKYRKIGVRTNADSPKDAEVAVKFGAEGIGLCRTEHMFFEGDRITSVRKLVLVAEEVKELRKQILYAEGKEKSALEAKIAIPLSQYNEALEELLPLQKEDFKGIFKAINGLPCTVRLLDPPLHEFLPHDVKGQEEMAEVMGLTLVKVKGLVDSLHEFNPMLGHRGCRLGITYPEVTQMQVRAIAEAAAEVAGSKPEIMVPLISDVKELESQKEIIVATIKDVENETGTKLNIKIGTMIEVPRAAITADAIAKEADFFSFGTNDLTQMGCGFSRDDAGKFLGDYVEKGIYEYDPFAVFDQEGIGKIVKYAVEAGRSTHPGIKMGICGEHGGDPSSVEFFCSIGLDYVSCSPYRVPIAILAAAHAAIKAEK